MKKLLFVAVIFSIASSLHAGSMADLFKGTGPTQISVGGVPSEPLSKEHCQRVLYDTGGMNIGGPAAQAYFDRLNAFRTKCRQRGWL